MGNRNRLMAALTKRFAPPAEHSRAAIFEAPSLLSKTLERDGYQLSHSSYLPNTNDVSHQDMTATTYEPGSFDLVVHNDVLEHIPDTAAALKDNERILRRGGMLIFTTRSSR